eukprot:9503999-Pyramimonas_sp.AAC.5
MEAQRLFTTVGFRISLSQSLSLGTLKAPQASSQARSEAGVRYRAPQASHFWSRAHSSERSMWTRAPFWPGGHSDDGSRITSGSRNASRTRASERKGVGSNVGE